MKITACRVVKPYIKARGMGKPELIYEILTAFGCASLVALSLAATGRLSAAAVIYPWCADYSGRMGGQNCGFTSLQQCLATQRGNGGSCNPNAWYQPYPPPASFAPPFRR